MIKTPAQHQTDSDKAPGQVRLWRPADQTLGDYVTRVQQQEAFEQVAQEKKLTFDEWYTASVQGPWSWQCDPDREFIDCMRACWKAAQENK